MTTGQGNNQGGREKLLPQNVEAEAGVLGSILIDPDALRRAMDLLAPEDFYRESHRTIFAAMTDLYGDDSPVDLITLCDELARRGNLEEVGGTSYVSALAEHIPTSRNVARYAQIVERTALLRRLIHAAGAIAGVAYNEPDAEEACNAALELVLEATRRRGPQEAQSFTAVLDDLLRDIHERMDHPEPAGVRTGIEQIDRHIFGLAPGELDYILARPGGGKTALGTTIAVNAALDCAARGQGSVDLFTMEMRSVQVARRVVGAAAGLDTRIIRAGFRDGADVDDAAYRAAEHAIQHLQEVQGERLFWHQRPMTLAQFRARVQRAIAERDCRLVVVDQLNKFTDQHKEGDTARMAMLSRGLAEIAKTLGVPIICMAQLNRGVEQRVNKRPVASDAKQSGQIEEDADMVWGLYCPSAYDADNPDPRFHELLEVLMLKVRDGMADGHMIPLRFEKRTQRITDWPDGVPLPADPTREPPVRLRRRVAGDEADNLPYSDD